MHSANGFTSHPEMKTVKTVNATTINIPEDAPVAGLRSLDHYKNRLPKWRYGSRQKVIPLVRWETPYLAWIQKRVRCAALDSYFAVTANLGTHTFFMVFLPILFWCGYTSLGRGLVHILASGVFFSGFLKDMLCLPRPLSPPLQRITMSGSAALEYGFPSTHSTNAASVAVYALFLLGSPTSTAHPKTTLLLEIGCYAYVLSILLGRLYCGMHGFMDVGIGSAIGALLSVLQCVYGEAFDEYLHSSSWVAPLTIAVIIITLIRIHPEPADDCPCFDDSVAFGGVVIGLEAGNWHYGNSGLAWNHPAPATVPFDLQQMGWFKAIARILVGVLIIFLWREVMKPLLLRGLPPLYRIFEKMGVSLPRKYFIKASQYKEVPAHLKVDNVFPSVSDLPSLLSSMRHPRKRAISVGPQSAADAYETLAYRETRRRESISAGRKRTKSHSHAHSHRRSESVPEDVNGDGSHGGGNYFPSLDSLEKNPPSVTTALSRPYESRDQINQHLHLHIPSTPHLPRVNSYERMMGSGSVIVTPASPSTPGSVTAGETFTIGSVPSSSSSSDGSESATQENEKETREMFSRLQKPRVRYDVEVVTKLIVYSGIAWLAVEGNPILFDLVGLGMGKQTR